MVRRLRVEFGLIVLLLGVTSGAFAGERGIVVSGVIRDLRGVPQMGALVQVLSPDSSVRATAFTDMQGRYLVQNLLPGLYGVRATAAMFLPAMRNNLRLQPGRRSVVNLTLSGLFNESVWLPARAKASGEQTDDWNWTLRSSASRPILKLDDDREDREDSGDQDASSGLEAGPRVMGPRFRASVSSPSRGFGNGSTRLSVHTVRRSPQAPELAFSGAIPGTGSEDAGDPLTVSSTFERQMGPAGSVATRVSYQSHPEIAGMDGASSLKLISISSAERFALGDLADIEAGSRVQAIMGPEAIIVNHPFVRVSAKGGTSWLVSYSLATAPDTQDFASAVMDDGDLPAVGRERTRAVSADGLHQAISLSHRSRSTLLAIALYTDDLHHIAISGNSDQGRLVSRQEPVEPVLSRVLLDGSMPPDQNVLLDQSNGAVQYLGPGYSNSGLNVLFTSELGRQMWIAVQYCTGSALGRFDAAPTAAAPAESSLSQLQARRAQSATVSLKTSIARTGTQVRTSYRWQPAVLVTSIDPYDVLAGGEYLSLHLRQPVSLMGILPEGTELTVDGSNLLGQGSQRFPAPNGIPLYLASTPMSLQAGLAFSF